MCSVYKLYVNYTVDYTKQCKAKPKAQANKPGRCTHRTGTIRSHEATQCYTQHVHGSPQIFVESATAKCCMMQYPLKLCQAPHIVPDAVHLPQWAVATEQSASSGSRQKLGDVSPTNTPF